MGLIAIFKLEPKGKKAEVLSYKDGLDMVATIISAEMHFRPGSDASVKLREQRDALIRKFEVIYDPTKVEDIKLRDVLKNVTEVSERIGRIRCNDREGCEEVVHFGKIVNYLYEYSLRRDSVISFEDW